MANDETFGDRLRKLPLWQWGLLCIFGGLVASMISGWIMPEARGAAAQGQAFGRMAASALFVLIGIGLVIAHFVRRNN